MKIIAATKNTNKIREIYDKLSGIKGIEILSASEAGGIPDVIEDGDTFEENALKKAREIVRHTGIPSMADDSGLVVDALGGEPGVLSARYGGANATDGDRNNLILKKMETVPDDQRQCRFICVIAIALPDGREFTARGVCEGLIAREMRGKEGFGYDPIFFLPDRGQTMAEIPLAEKNTISHRARALDGAVKILESLKA